MVARGWMTVVWRLLCLFALMSGLLLVTGVLFLLPLVLQGVAVLSGLLVTGLYVTAWYADWSKRSGR